MNQEQILQLAEERGYRGNTFATQEEIATPGYDQAYMCGMARRSQDGGCPGCGGI